MKKKINKKEKLIFCSLRVNISFFYYISEGINLTSMYPSNTSISFFIWFFNVFNINYVNLSSWFSADYLGLNGWGIGFSIIAESVINFGYYFG